MAPTLYTPLPIDKFSIRLIKLQPAYTTSAPILCKLINHPIDSERIVAHSYECLSYVWGPSENPQLISIDTGEAVFPFQTTPNLYEALQHLRDSCFEQILWIDAVCINQRDDEEKATQVAAMARIYGLAKRVIVWLGAETNDSTLAFERLRDLAQPRETEAPPQHRDEDGPVAEHAIQTLLSRPYFRRMWVLQEVAAARNMVFRCGSAEMQTETFRAGLHALARLDDWELRHRILAFLLLIGTSIFRERLKGRPHLEFEPLNDLIDRFHAHDASDPRDKIYALWGLCSDSSSMESLQPNYDKKWKDLFEDLGKLMFGKESAVSASPLRQLM
ncbi:HET-domain-containing protein, partial [Paraphaeosphaeria sporulosa]